MTNEKEEHLFMQELSDYEFPAGKSLQDFQPAAGGQPIRAMVATTWRSGSTFLGEGKGGLTFLGRLAETPVLQIDLIFTNNFCQIIKLSLNVNCRQIGTISC